MENFWHVSLLDGHSLDILAENVEMAEQGDGYTIVADTVRIYLNSEVVSIDEIEDEI